MDDVKKTEVVVEPEMEMAKLSLVIDVNYELCGTPIEELKRQLNWAAMHLSGEGLLTSGTNALVEEWSHRVEEPEG